MAKKTTYGYSTEVNLDFDTAVQKTTELLKERGFGILTTIDVKAKLKEKVDKDMEDYVILGSCSPPSAVKALDAEIEIGLLLPCNVIVYVKDSKTHVSAIMPSAMMAAIGNPALDEVAAFVEEKLKEVVDQLS